MTEYINDINRENTEVLAEYGADEKVRQAYTYGESGIGERVSVDKSEESSYYLYDGRNSVTGILTENANLTNSYQYDPYGNLTSRTADGVNYYGYNGESTNVKTGLQYLRARYYDAENGTFTTEDSDLGTTENPLTRNRYDYTTNNPLNYSDPTGHSLWSRIKSTAKKAAKAVKSVGKKIVNTAKKVVKTVVNTAKKAAKTIVNAVKGAAKTVKNAVTHPKQTYQSVKNRVTSSSTYQKITSRGSQFIRSVSNGVQRVGKTYTSFTSYVSERTETIRTEIKRVMCTSKAVVSTVVKTNEILLNYKLNNTVLGELIKYISSHHVVVTNQLGLLEGSLKWLAGMGMLAGGAALAAIGIGGTAITVGGALVPGTVAVGTGIAAAGTGIILIQQGSASISNSLSFSKSNTNSSHLSNNEGENLGKYKFKEGIDEDLRNGKGTFNEALDEAFEKTGTPKEDFSVTKWGKDQYGKSHPVEWKAENGAEVSIDKGHPIDSEAPTADHVGWQTGGKRSNGGAVRGHIFVDEVPYNR